MSQERPKPSAIEQIKARSQRYETAVSALQARRDVLGTPQGPARFNLAGKEGEAFLAGAVRIGVKTQRIAETVIPRLESKRAALDEKVAAVHTQAEAIENRFAQVAQQHERGFVTSAIFEQAKAEKDRAIAALLGQPAKEVPSTPEAPAPAVAAVTQPTKAEEPITPPQPVQNGSRFEPLTPADLKELGISPRSKRPQNAPQARGGKSRGRRGEKNKPSHERHISTNLATQLSTVVELYGGKPFTVNDAVDAMKRPDEKIEQARIRLGGDTLRALNRMGTLGMVTEEFGEDRKKIFTAIEGLSPADIVARLTEKPTTPATPRAPRPERAPAAPKASRPAEPASATPTEAASLQPNTKGRNRAVLNAIASAITSLSVSNPSGFMVKDIVVQLKRPDEPEAKATIRLQGDISRAIKAQKAAGTLQEKWTKNDGKALKVYSVRDSAETAANTPPVNTSSEPAAEPAPTVAESAPETATQFEPLSREELAARGVIFQDTINPGVKKK